MSGQFVIDPARFARDRSRLTGSLAVAALPRLAEQVGLAERAGDAGGSIQYDVAGFLDDLGRPVLRLRLDGVVELRCQRCLGPLPTRVDAQRDIVLVPGADEFAPFDDEDESTDIIPAVARLDLSVLLEDEVLLGLPAAPRHADDDCQAEGTAEVVRPERASPFAVLAKLKHG
jgi:uncharacterized protein